MSYDEMCEAIYKAVNDMFDECQIPCKVIVNKRYERYMLDTHKLYTGSDKAETIFGVPLEFSELPDNLNFIVEAAPTIIEAEEDSDAED